MRLPRTLDELCDYIVENADKIAVREQVDGKWGSYWLTELPVKLALKHAMLFVKEGRIPVVVKKSHEQRKFDYQVKLRTVGEVICWLNQFPSDAYVYAYEGEVVGLVVVSNKPELLDGIRVFPELGFLETDHP